MCAYILTDFIECESFALVYSFACLLRLFHSFSMPFAFAYTLHFIKKTHHTVRLSMIYSIVECFHRFMISVTIRLYFGTAAVLCYMCVALNHIFLLFFLECVSLYIFISFWISHIFSAFFSSIVQQIQTVKRKKKRRSISVHVQLSWWTFQWKYKRTFVNDDRIHSLINSKNILDIFALKEKWWNLYDI